MSRFVTTSLDDFFLVGDNGEKMPGLFSGSEKTGTSTEKSLLFTLSSSPFSSDPEDVLDVLSGRIRKLARQARQDLLTALGSAGTVDAMSIVRKWTEAWTPQLAGLLGESSLAGNLHGMAALAGKLDGDLDQPSPAVLQQTQDALPLVKEAAARLSSMRLLGLPEYVRLGDSSSQQGLIAADQLTSDVQSKVRESLVRAMETGGTLEAFRRDLRESFSDGILTPDHAETVFRTNILSAYSDGQERLLADPAVGELFPYAAYHATHDDRVRPEHLDMERRGIGGTNIYRRDDPVWQLFRPTWGHNCRCTWTSLSVAEAARRGIAEAIEWQQSGVEPAAKAFVEMPPFRPDAEFTNRAVELAATWERYEGPRGGTGWKNAATGEVLYQEENPNEHGKVASQEEPVTPKKQKASRGEMASARREGAGKDARVVMADGTPAPAHVKASMVPPDWREVMVSTDPDADVVVTARDKNGRAKTVYSDSFHMRQAAAKFARTQEGILLSGQMAEENQANRNKPELLEQADCCWLMMEQATRPGSESDNKGVAQYFDHPVNVNDVVEEGGKVAIRVGDSLLPIKDKKTRAELLRRRDAGEPLMDSTYWLKSHGATTLEGRHVVETPDGVFLRFVGKESVYHNHRVRSPELAAMLVERKKKAGDRGKLFDTNYDKVTSYAKTLDGGKFTPKDFRTQRATRLAIEEIRKMEVPVDEKSYKSQVKRVGEIVSSVLGNEPAQALESYIDPSVFSIWRAA